MYVYAHIRNMHAHTRTHTVPSVEVFLTAYQALTWNGHLKDNETILIHAVRIRYSYDTL